MQICFNRQTSSTHYLLLLNSGMLASYSSYLDIDMRIKRSAAGIDERRFSEILGEIYTHK